MYNPIMQVVAVTFKSSSVPHGGYAHSKLSGEGTSNKTAQNAVVFFLRKKEAAEEVKMDITRLPEGCIANMISLTSPRDACRSSLVSKAFESAAASNPVWERFLPPDYQQIMSESVSSLSSFLDILPKKDLYFFLCDHPILIGDGNISWAIDKLSGKKCYMLAARALSISWGATEAYWQWISPAELPFLLVSRFSEVANLNSVCWLDVRGKIETKILSPNTTYGAYFIYTLSDRAIGLELPVKVSLGVGNEMEGHTANAYLQMQSGGPRIHGRQDDDRLPRTREDMWLEIEIGEFSSGQIDGMVEMCLKEIEKLNWKSGLVVYGIELRPKAQR